MKKIKVLYAAFEAVPFIKTGGLGDVAGSFPKALIKSGVSARLIMPKFGSIPENYTKKMRHIADFYIDLSWRRQYCGIESLTLNGVTCYFIDNEYYFKRQAAYGYDDDNERIAFFSKAVIDSLKYLPRFSPDIIHCNDWHTALIPVYLKTLYRNDEKCSKIKTVFTIHNLKLQGIFPRWIAGDIFGLADCQAEEAGLFNGDCTNYMKGALCTADRLTTVSPSYAEEICSAFYGEGLDGVFRSKKDILSGILNGIDTSMFDPMTDKAIPFHFDTSDMEGKALNKKALREKLGLSESAAPVAAIISRLTSQKGLDLVIRIVEELLQEDIQIAVLGVGEKIYEDNFRRLAGKYPGKFAAAIYFDEELSHLIYAGADMLLVPSLFEPCGLSQMFAMRYGTLPIVRETGGLKDSVEPYNKYEHTGTGFSFQNFNAHELLFTVKDALRLYSSERDFWDDMVRRAMDQDFSWSVSAEKYLALYTELLK